MWIKDYLKENHGMSEDRQESFFNFLVDTYDEKLEPTDDVEDLSEDCLEEYISVFYDAVPEGINYGSED